MTLRTAGVEADAIDFNVHCWVRCLGISCKPLVAQLCHAKSAAQVVKLRGFSQEMAQDLQQLQARHGSLAKLAGVPCDLWLVGGRWTEMYHTRSPMSPCEHAFQSSTAHCFLSLGIWFLFCSFAFSHFGSFFGGPPPAARSYGSQFF